MEELERSGQMAAAQSRTLESVADSNVRDWAAVRTLSRSCKPGYRATHEPQPNTGSIRGPALLPKTYKSRRTLSPASPKKILQVELYSLILVERLRSFAPVGR